MHSVYLRLDPISHDPNRLLISRSILPVTAKVVPCLFASSHSKNDDKGEPSGGGVNRGDVGPKLENSDEKKVLVHETTETGETGERGNTSL